MSEVTKEQSLGGLDAMSFTKGVKNVVETPVAEEPVQTKEDTVEKTETPKEEAQEEVVEQKAEEASEPTTEKEDGDKFQMIDLGEDSPQVVENNQETIEAYKTQLESLQKEIQKLKEQPTLDPRIAKLNEIIQNGGDINKSVWDMQSKDYANADIKNQDTAFSVLADKLKYLDGDDNELVEFYLDENFPTLRGKKTEDDFDSDEEYESQKRKESMLLRKEAKSNIESLKEFQEKMRLPNAPDHNRVKEQEEAIKSYKAHATTALNEIDGFVVEFSDGVPLKFPFAGEGREFAKSIVVNPENQANFFNSRYTTESGEVDFKSFSEDMYFLQNRNKVFNALLAQGKSLGKKEALEELQSDNAKLPNKKPQSPKMDKVSQGFANLSFSKPTRR